MGRGVDAGASGWLSARRFLLVSKLTDKNLHTINRRQAAPAPNRSHALSNNSKYPIYMDEMEGN